ncbi:YitT family protein [Aminivibrio sp.]
MGPTRLGRIIKGQFLRFMVEVRAEWGAFLAVTAGVTIQALAVVLFVLPNRFPDLGVSGLAVLSNYVFHISPAWVILILNTLLMAWAWRELSPRFVLWTAWGVVLFSLLLKLFEYVPVPVIGDKFMAAMVSGVVRGIGAGLVFRVGASTGGLDIPGVALRRRYGIEMGRFSIFINMGILALSFFVVGLDATIYGAVALYVFGIVVDNTLRTFDRRKQVLLITSIPDEVSDFINTTLRRGATRLCATGGFSKQDRPVLLTLLEPRQVMVLKKHLAENDPGAFMSVTDAAEVVGKGFKSWTNL